MTSDEAVRSFMTLDQDALKKAIQVAVAVLDVNALSKTLRSVLFVRTDNKLPSTGKPVRWSVKHSRGTAYGWIQIDAPRAVRETGSDEVKKEHMLLLSKLLGEPYHHQGISVAPQSDCRRVYLAHCLTGTALGFTWKKDWD